MRAAVLLPPGQHLPAVLSAHCSFTTHHTTHPPTHPPTPPACSEEDEGEEGVGPEVPSSESESELEAEEEEEGEEVRGSCRPGSAHQGAHPVLCWSTGQPG